MNSLIIIENDGPLITKNNFWETEWNICGRFLLSANAAAYRLLVPDDGLVDEAFVGPKGRPKTPVVALIERHGLARVKIIASISQHNLGAALAECVSQEAVVNTDEHPGYKNPLKAWKAHRTVNHSRGEYQKQHPDGSRSSINTAESFFSLFKQAIVGAWHHISREHLARYANEFAFRWNTRQASDGERIERFVQWFEGKRLTYRQTAKHSCVC